MKHIYSTLLALILLSPATFAQPTELDQSFGDSGYVLTRLNFRYGFTGRQYVYSDGKILNGGDRYLIRYNADGTLDHTFSNGGISFEEPRTITGITVQPDNRILVSTDNDFNLTARRYLPNGKKDSSFGTNGTAVFNSLSGSAAQGIALQKSGKIIVAGIQYTGNSYTRIALTRFTKNGQVDSSFGFKGGKAFKYTRTLNTTGVLIQPDDKILVECYADGFGKTGLYIVRFMPNGAVDSSFGTDGVFYSSLVDTRGSSTLTMALQPDGKIVAGGSPQQPQAGDTVKDFVLVRVKPNGTIDNSFGQSGYTYTTFADHNAGISSICLQPDGKIVSIGNVGSYDKDRPGIGLTRHLANGKIDKQFGNNGKILIHRAGYYFNIPAVNIQQNNKIVFSTYVDSGNYLGNYKRFNFVARLKNVEAIAEKSSGDVKTNIVIEKKISLLPNPATDVIKVTGLQPEQRTTIQIINAGGKVLSEVLVQSFIYTLNVKNLTAGIYYAIVKSEGKTQTIKFVKQ